MTSRKPAAALVSFALRALGALATFGAPAAGAEDYVWWEGEKPVETNFPKKTWFSASTFEGTRHEILSAGDWLTNAGKREGAEGFAKYEVDVPAAGEYALWVRKFWKHGPFRWRFGAGEWRTCGRDCDLADSTDIRKHLCVNWVHLGKVKLAAGRQAFELRLLAKPGEDLVACFDCFLLTPRAFTPRGKLKPGEKSGRAEPGWWAFEPEYDRFEDSPVDLRRLNERKAGESGFVKRKGLDFVLGSGKTVRFWGVNLGVGLDHGSMDHMARHLAKHGVNIVRMHGAVFDRNAADPGSINEKKLEQIQYAVAALAKEGIYSKLSFYFPLWFDVKPGYGIPGYETIQNKKPFALLYFDRRMQEIYRAWAKGLILTRNPYTGVPLAKDPAVAIIEIVNEDSYLFWTFGRRNVPDVQMRRLEKEYGAWLARKYGSVQAAKDAWGGESHGKDRPGEGVMTIYDIWHMTAQGHGGGAKRKRMRDQLEFLTQHQKKFYEDTIRFFRDDLGTRSMVSCSNWHTADARVLDGLERYTYTAGDVIDRHGYFSTNHKGPRSGYAVDVNDTYDPSTGAGVLTPGKLPLQFNQVDDWPHIITEIGWTCPNRFRAEWPVLCSAYGALQGVDGFFLFAMRREWEHSTRKFNVETPTVLGQFPAAALIYRRGYLKEAETLIHEVLRLDDLYDFKGSAGFTAQNLDELRKADVPQGGVARGKDVPSIDPLSFFAGRVLRSFGEDRSKAVLADVTKLVDRGAKVIRSGTGELAWDFGRGTVTVNAPKAQGAVGFLGKAGRIELKDIVIECANEYASILVVSLDEKPLSYSRSVLVQAATEDKPYGFRVEGGRVRDLGGYPLNVRNLDASVTLKVRRRARSADVLDGNGYARGKLEPERTAEGARLKLAPDALYTIVK